MWSAVELAGDPVVSGALRGGRPRVALASRQHGVKVEIDAVAVHEVTVDDEVHVAIQVLREHVYVQVCGQPVLTGGETGRSSKLTHRLQTDTGPPVKRAQPWQRCVLGFESGEL